MLKVEWTNRDALDCSNITCANCQYNDGVVYTSMPPQYKCTITNKFHRNNDKCDVEFAPVRHAHWTEEYLASTSGGFYQVFRCSNCQWDILGIFHPSNYCPNCGAKMEKNL